MAITLVQSATTNDGSNYVPLGAAPTAGNLLVCFATARGAPVVNAWSGWTEHPDGHLVTVDNDLADMWYRTADGSEGTTIQVTALGTGNNPMFTIAEFSGLAGTLVDSGASAGQSQTGFVGGTVTPDSGSNALVIGGVCYTLNDGAVPVMTPAAGWTEIEEVETAGGFHPLLWLAYQVVPSASGTYTPLASCPDQGSTRHSYVGLTLAFAGPTTPPPPVDVGVYDRDNVLVANLSDAFDVRIRAEHNAPGSGEFKINRYSSQATAANLAKGNIVRVTFGEIDPDPIFEFIIDQGDFGLVSSDEEGGENLQFGGPGSLSYLGEARLSHENLTYPSDGNPVEDLGVWQWSAEQAGSMIRRMLDEVQARTPPALGALSRTFDDVNDSDGNPWTNLGSLWQAPIGSDLFTEVMRLVAAGQLSVRMDPPLTLSCWENFGGNDLTSTTFADGKVRFVKGVNISSELGRKMSVRDWNSHVLVKTDGPVWAWYNAASYPYRKEGYLDLSSTTDDTGVAAAAAEILLGAGDDALQAIILEHVPPLPGTDPDFLTGSYLPGQDWTDHGCFWVGDLVTLHTGTGEFDYDNVTHRVHAITLYQDETGALAPPIVELNAPFPHGGDETTSAVPVSAGGTDGSSGGSTGFHLHPQYTTDAEAEVIADAAVATHTGDATDAHDASAISYDPTSSGLSSTDVQAAIDELEASIGTPSLALDDLTDVTITAPSDGDVLTYDTGTSEWVNAAPSGGVAALDDIGDVNAPTPSDGDVLAWDNGAGEWVNAAPGTPADILDIPTAETDTSLVLAPDGAGGVEFRADSGGSTWPPLDRYTMDGTYGDQFTGASLDAKWTRHGYTGTEEEFQAGIDATYLRLKTTGQVVGNGYFQTAPAGDFTIAAKITQRGNVSSYSMGIAIIDSSGNGVGTTWYTSAPNSPLLLKFATYSTYSNVYVEPGGSGTNQNIGYTNVGVALERPVWWKLRKSSNNYYMAYSVDGEAWSTETPALAYTFTVDRIGFMHTPLSTPSQSALTRVEIDWFTTI